MILIVDDNAPIRGLIKQHIQKINPAQELFECTDAAEAVELCRHDPPDWILMDIKMPGLDGLAATSEILQIYPDARIIIVTNFDDPELRNAARANGARGYVLKERLFELQELMR